jgi:hypothetical protein
MLSSRASAIAGLSALILIALVVPLAIPLASPRQAAAPLPPTYLPSLEGPRERTPFTDTRVSDLRLLQPGYVVIGDSMAGTRSRVSRSARCCSPDRGRHSGISR